MICHLRQLCLPHLPHLHHPRHPGGGEGGRTGRQVADEKINLDETEGRMEWWRFFLGREVGEGGEGGCRRSDGDVG